MNHLWDSENFQNELSPTEKAFFSLSQKLNSMADIEMQRQALNDHLKKLNLYQNIVFILIVCLTVPASLVPASLVLWSMNFNGIPIPAFYSGIAVFVIILVVLLSLYIFRTDRVESLERLNRYLSPISSDGEKCKEAKTLCEESTWADEWRKQAVISRQAILEGDLMIMMSLSAIEKRSVDESVASEKYQELLKVH